MAVHRAQIRIDGRALAREAPAGLFQSTAQLGFARGTRCSLLVSASHILINLGNSGKMARRGKQKTTEYTEYTERNSKSSFRVFRVFRGLIQARKRRST